MWIVLTAAWIATIAGIDRPDRQFALARQPIEISYGEMLIEFPVGTDQDTIAGAINKWIAEENVILEKLGKGVPLSSLSDEELWTLADHLLTDKRPIDTRRQIEDRMSQHPWMTDPLASVGYELAAKALAIRPVDVSTVVTSFLVRALGPPAALLLFAVIASWVLAGFRLPRRN